MQKIQITIVPREIGQLWDQILQNVLHDICKPPVILQNKPISELIPHTFNEKFGVHIGKCYYQHSPNLCGYHATFNTLCFLNAVRKGATSYDMQSGASFWSFKKKVERFLKEIKIINKLPNQWPWREEDIIHGDFERSYNKLSLDYFSDFQVFRNHQEFQLIPFTWEFQYENLLISEDKKRELNRHINYFRKYNSKKPLIIAFMLAITNHWMCFFAVKQEQKTQYWFFDSSHRQFFDLNHQQILQYVEVLDDEELAVSDKRFTPFFKQNMGVCMMDTQISIRLIKDCLEGRTTIEQYTYNQQFNVFAKHLEKHWDHDLQEVDATVKDYWHNIYAFFRNPLQLHLFSQQNQVRLFKLIQLSNTLRTRSQQGKKLHQLLRRYSHETHM